MISKANLEGKLPFEMRFGRFGPKMIKFHVDLEGFAAYNMPRDQLCGTVHAKFLSLSFWPRRSCFFGFDGFDRRGGALLFSAHHPKTLFSNGF